MLTEQQKARIVELARKCERQLSLSEIVGPFSGTFRLGAERASAEAFRIAQEATRHA